MARNRGYARRPAAVIAVIGVLAIIASFLLWLPSHNRFNRQAGGNERPGIHILTASPYGIMTRIDANNPYNQKLEQLSGYKVNFEILSWNEYDAQLSVRYLTNDLPDLVYTSAIESTTHPAALEQGKWHRLNDLIDEYGPHLKEKIPASVWRHPDVSNNGDIYAIPGLVPHAHTAILYIREDWLESLGLSYPETLDEWLHYFEQVKQHDMNGDGDPTNEYGLYIRENMPSSMPFFHEFGAGLNDWVWQENEYVPSIITPNMKEAVSFWRELYRSGYINPNAFTNKLYHWRKGILEGQAGSWVHYVDNRLNWWLPELFSEQHARPSFIAPPRGPIAQGLGLENPGLFYVWVIPSTVSDPERVVQFLDKVWGDPDIQHLYRYGIEGIDYERMADGSIIAKTPEESVLSRDDGDWSLRGEDLHKMIYQVQLNVTGHSMNQEEASLKTLQEGYDIADHYRIETVAIYMPMLEAIKEHPELHPGFGNGDTLFSDFFVKAVTSNEPIDDAFERFVRTWKERGGVDAIVQATAWYEAFQQQW